MAYFKCEKSSVMLKKLIWNNPSPTTAFQAQTLVMDLSMYDGVIIRCAYATNYNTDAQKPYQLFNYVPKDGVDHWIGSSLSTSGTGYCWGRKVAVTDSGITFSVAGYPGTLANVGNGYVIPTEIYGYAYQPNIVTGSSCNYLLSSVLPISGSRSYNYVANKKAVIMITMSSRNIATHLVRKNGNIVQELSPTTAEGSGGINYCYLVSVENGDVIDVTCINDSGTYNIGYLNILEIPSIIN